jgi:cell division septation protein DedD
VNAKGLMALLLGFLLGSVGVVVALVLAGIDLSVPRPPERSRPPAGLAHEASPRLLAVSRVEPANRQAISRDLDRHRLRRAQDTYLEALAIRRTDARAMRALVVVRQKLAGYNPEVLREQARVSREVAAAGRSLAGYTPVALSLLAEADTRAAADIERTQRRLPEARSVRPQAGVRAARAATRAVTLRVAVARPSPPRRRAAAPVVPKEHEPRFVVRVGPISFLDRATRIVGELQADGLSATVEPGQESRQFRVVSAKLIQAAAERRRAFLESMGHRPTLRRLPGGLTQLELGPFTSRVRAEAVAAEIRRGGSYASVTAEGGTGHTIVVGPYPKSAINGVIERIGARFGTDAAVTVRPAD